VLIVTLLAALAFAQNTRAPVGGPGNTQLLPLNTIGGSVTNRAVRVNSQGRLAVVTGTLTDCVLVNGSSGPCGSGSGDVPSTRTISTTLPLTGGGDLSANRTISMPAAATGQSGYLTSTDWNTFNSKVGTARTISTSAPLGGGGDLSSDRTLTCSTCEVTTNKNASSGYAGLSAGKLTASVGQEVWSVADLTEYTGSSGSGATAVRSTFTNLTNGDVLTWSGSNWVNQTPTGVSTIAGLTDTRVTKTDNTHLAYSGGYVRCGVTPVSTAAIASITLASGSAGTVHVGVNCAASGAIVIASGTLSITGSGFTPSADSDLSNYQNIIPIASVTVATSAFGTPVNYNSMVSGGGVTCSTGLTCDIDANGLWRLAVDSTIALRTLSNLSSVSINTALIPQTGVDLGAAATAFRDIYLYGSGTFGSHSIKLTSAPTGNRVVTLPNFTTTLIGTSGSLTTNNIARFNANGEVIDAGVAIGNVVQRTSTNFTATEILLAETSSGIGHSGILVSGDDTSASRTVSFGVSGTDPVVTVGASSFDISTGTLKQGGNPVETKAANTQVKTFIIPGTGVSNVLQDADDQQSVWNNQHGGAITISSVTCESDAGTPSIQLQKDDGSPTNMLSASPGFGCATTPATTTSFVSGENVLAAGDRLDFLSISAGGSAHWVSVTFVYTRN